SLGEVDDVEDAILLHRAPQRLGQLLLPTIGAGLESETKSVHRHPSQLTQAKNLGCLEAEAGWGLEDEERGPQNTGDPQVVGECRPGPRRGPKSICVGGGRN